MYIQLPYRTAWLIVIIITVLHRLFAGSLQEL